MAWWKALAWACMAAAVAAPAHAQWKWKDAAGQVHMSDLPPPRDVPAKDILQQPSGAAVRRPAAAPTAPAASAPATAATPAIGPASDAKGRADPELEAKRKQADQEKAAKAKAEEDRIAAARADNCARAREHLAGLESGLRVARVNAKGEREFLDDKARSDEVARTRQVMSTDCR
jgi:Domain of unknown function (DUF4124)